jgi:hypothetical protein
MASENCLDFASGRSSNTWNDPNGNAKRFHSYVSLLETATEEKNGAVKKCAQTPAPEDIPWIPVSCGEYKAKMP